MSRPLAGSSRQVKNQCSLRNATTYFKWYRPLGKLYRRADNGGQAQEHLTIATAMFREMGMSYWPGQAEAQMRILG